MENVRQHAGDGEEPASGFDRMYDVVVIGGGSAGLAAAVSARESARARVLVIERDAFLGGVLPQCVHDGFGLYCFGESLTGPEYARRWIDRAQACGVEYVLDTCVLGVTKGSDGLFAIDAVGLALGGRACVKARALVCATGCRERTRGAMEIPGGRPAGVLTAGTAQYMVNVADQMPGDKVVVLGSGDVGLIMARRMTLEGAEVRLVLGQEATGLVRNHIRCIDDFDIPIRYGWGLVRIHGFGQLQGVTVAPLSEDGTFDLTRREYIRCNVLLIACGLVPEREAIADVRGLGPEEGLFICGNANTPHDLVDQVSQEGVVCGRAAALFARGGAEGACALPADLERIARMRIVEPKGRMSEMTEPVPEGARRLVCTVCPTGCVLTAAADGSVEGNACPRGEAYAAAELADPKRLFTGTVRIAGSDRQLVPVRTAAPVPRASLRDIARRCRRVTARLPIAMGQVIVENICDTGVDLIASDERGADAVALGTGGVGCVRSESPEPASTGCAPSSDERGVGAEG